MSRSTPRAASGSTSTALDSHRVASGSGALSVRQSTPGVSLNKQVVLDEDDYTASLSHIIQRDFFPDLPKLAATNAYLSALESEDTSGIAKSIRDLSKLAKPSASPRDGQGGNSTRRRQRDMEIAGTPYVSRTPFRGSLGDINMDVDVEEPVAGPSRLGLGQRGWETPLTVGRGRTRDGWTPARSVRGTSVDEEEDEADMKRRRIDINKGLDDFQAQYTSEDNASFVQIVDEENRVRREKYSWAYEAEKKANEKRLRLEQERRIGLIEAGGYVEDDGLLPRAIEAPKPTHRLAIAGRNSTAAVPQPRALLTMKEETAHAIADERSSDSDNGQGEKRDRALTLRNDADTDNIADTAVATRPEPSQSLIVAQVAPTLNQPDISDQQLVIPNALPRAPSPPTIPEDAHSLVELELRSETHLAQALSGAGLPETALVTRSGEIVPGREVASGAGDGLGRGAEDRERREEADEAVMAAQKDNRGKEVPQWRYTTRNALMFGPDANRDPLKQPLQREVDDETTRRRFSKEIRHSNTRLPEDGDDEPAVGSSASSSRRASSPTRSRVAAAISGTPYHREDSMPTFGSYALVPDAPSPSPSELGPSAVSQLMTWGELLSTPRALHSGEEDPSSSDPDARRFRLPEEQARDRLGRRLANDASRAMRDRAKGYGSSPRGLAVLGGGGGTGSFSRHASGRREGGGTTGTLGGRRHGYSDMGPPPTTPRRTADDLTPAARSLLQRSTKRGGMGTPGSGGLGGAAVRSRSEAMERTGAWNLRGGSKKSSGAPMRDRTWTPSPAVRRDG